MGTTYLEEFLHLLPISQVFHSCMCSMPYKTMILFYIFQIDCILYLKILHRDLSFNNLSGPTPKILAKGYR